MSRRMREGGIRIAIGAQRHTVPRMVMRESLLMVVIGVTLGIPVALSTGHFISSQFFGVSPRDRGSLAPAGCFRGREPSAGAAQRLIRWSPSDTSSY